ncbi:ABC transporter ATP binding protein [Leifsonia xyli subsp. cynodontis DSM 46306]|uniref:ABC transporter domain-containing protein n=1 Tax=Leifsonia xyli subsp. cynodontis DSM 46306 TaxID=1389489 RepID=U3P8F2_LEIXC|nr:ABC transporter ATP binding protein [Leifsonia xyli subsp. cynodontis DSM 46306]
MKKWQAFQGVDMDGVVAVGDIVYFQTLPVGVELDPEQIQVGRALAGGEPGIKVTVSPPTFVISLTADQAKEIDVGTPVSVPQSTATWQGTVSQLVVQSDQSVNAVLEGVGGEPFCGQECDTVPAAGQPSLPGIATLTPRTAGIVVPTAAVQTRSNGLTVVVDRQGTKRAVTVAVSAGGKSVIRGVPEGTEVRVGGPVISVHDLSYAYKRAGTPIIENLTVDFPRGTITALTGPSGKGKSTLLYILGLMLVPNAGDVVVNGTHTRRLDDNSRSKLRAEYFGFVFQDAVLDPIRTVADNILEPTLYNGRSRASMADRNANGPVRGGVA